MSSSKNYMFKFLINKIRNVLVIGLLISIALFVFLGQKSLVQYVFGGLLGVLNFMLLTIGMDLILDLKPLTARIMHLIFFSFRYIAIAVVIALFIIRRNANAFVVVGGLLTMHFSLFVTEAVKHLLSRKEG